ncbi:unnamed protein product [Lymnaea stagnalis]|uniref:Uncharacterized protein n=1 Tax=Lymnaea stagnalis TaxID=6523 RepID=A0AAV2HWJ9_LYMST
MWSLILTLLALGHVTCVLGILPLKNRWNPWNPGNPKWPPFVVSKRDAGLDIRDTINKDNDFGDRNVISKRDVEKRIYYQPIDSQPWEPDWQSPLQPPVYSKRENGLDARAAINKDNDFGDRNVISKRDVEKRVYLPYPRPWRPWGKPWGNPWKLPQPSLG